MSYAIGHVIFGIAYDDYIEEDINEKFKEDPKLSEEYDPGDIESMGFETTYSGSASGQIGWIGKCYDTIDECNDFDVDDWYNSLNSKREEFQQDFEKCMEDVPDFLKEILKDEQPKLYVVWGTS